MIRRMRDGWWLFKAGKPGHRFRNRYRRNRRSGPGRFATRKALVIVGGIVIVVASLLLAPLPGPGWGTSFVGLGIVAGEVSHVARLLDRAEVKLREALQRATGVWGRSASAVRTLLALTISLGVVASVYGAYHVFLVALSALPIPLG